MRPRDHGISDVTSVRLYAIVCLFETPRGGSQGTREFFWSAYKIQVFYDDTNLTYKYLFILHFKSYFNKWKLWETSLYNLNI